MKPDKDRMFRHIADHTLWFSSAGSAGFRGDVSGCDLTGLSESDMVGLTLKNAYHDEHTIWPEWMKGKHNVTYHETRGPY